MDNFWETALAVGWKDMVDWKETPPTSMAILLSSNSFAEACISASQYTPDTAGVDALLGAALGGPPPVPSSALPRQALNCHHEWPVESIPSCFLLSHKSSLCVIADLCNAGISWSQLCPARGRTSSAGFECPCAYFLLLLYGNLLLPCSRYDHTQSGQDLPCLREEDNGGQPNKA